MSFRNRAPHTLALIITAFSLGAAACGAPADDPAFSDQEMGYTSDAERPLPPRLDADQDGAPIWKDCDDADASVYPGAKEVCDGRDNDCDGFVDTDSDDANTYYEDSDRDGYGGATTVVACSEPFGFSLEGGDCDDSRSDVHPDAPATCDGADSNCDGTNADELSFCYNVGEPIDDPSDFDPGDGDPVDDPSGFDPGDGDGADDPSGFDPGDGDGADDPSGFDPLAP